jgi:hypothetical protein
VFREVLRLQGLSEVAHSNEQSKLGTNRSFCVGHDFSRFFTLALELSRQSDLGCPQPEIFNIERGYLSIQLLDADTKCRIKSKVPSALTLFYPLEHYALRNMFIGEEKFLLDCHTVSIHRRD